MRLDQDHRKWQRLAELGTLALLVAGWLCLVFVMDWDLAEGSDSDWRFQALRLWLEEGVRPAVKWPRDLGRSWERRSSTSGGLSGHPSGGCMRTRPSSPEQAL